MTRSPHRILCVCLGNICRSPTAEAALRAELGPRAVIDSAGTGNWHVGKPPYGPMRTAAAARRLDLSALRARQVRHSDFDAFDLILAMDADNMDALHRLAPTPAAAARVSMFLDPIGGGDVPDPYFTRDFDGALTLIQTAALAWADRLRRP